MQNTLVCESCGGKVEFNEHSSIGRCLYCGNQFVIPKSSSRKSELLNRAVFLRKNNEFDRAAAVYEDFLKEDPTDAGAHWGLVLCKYGIEYVKDTRTDEYLPTCHRIEMHAILSDPDYLAALEYADGESRQVMEAEARRIHEIHLKILELCRKEPPYDVFISYKETDGQEERTEDSVIAQELYNYLSRQGLRVFFARKTLETKLGQEYEPIISAALMSAKVMIVLGLKVEHFNAVWVRNEWSRFLRMGATQDKAVIVAYRDLSPYDLPGDLARCQSQDLSKIGAIQNLADGVGRILSAGKPAGPAPKEPDNTAEKLFANAATYIRLGDIAAANGYYQTAVKEYAGDHRGWWGLIVCATNGLTRLADDQKQIDTWIGYVKTLADPASFAQLGPKYADYLRLIAEQDVQRELEQATADKQTLSKRLITDRSSLTSIDSASLKNSYATDKRRHKAAIKKARPRFLLLPLGVLCFFLFRWLSGWLQTYLEANASGMEDRLLTLGNAGVTVTGALTYILPAFCLFAFLVSLRHLRRLFAEKKALKQLKSDYDQKMAAQKEQKQLLQQSIAEGEQTLRELETKIREMTDRPGAYAQKHLRNRCEALGIDPDAQA